MKERLSVLLVDDEPMVIKSVARFLQIHNHKITTCPDGKEAIKAASSNHFDAVIADYHLPCLNGLQVLQHLKKTSCPHCRLIMTSGSADTDLLAATIPHDDITFLPKPFELEALLNLLCS